MRKKIPHYSKINTYQFVTFRTKDSVDDYLLKINSQNSISNSQKQLKIDEYLDTSLEGRILNKDIINIVLDYAKDMDPMYYRLICISIMPNHIHILFQQKKDLKKIMQILKGGLSFRINAKLKRTKGLWDSNYFDKAIRNEKHLNLTYQYIKNNAIKANLIDAEERFFGVYE